MVEWLDTQRQQQLLPSYMKLIGCLWEQYERRGWLGRVETSDGDAEAFQGLQTALTSLAGKQGIRLIRRTNMVGHPSVCFTFFLRHLKIVPAYVSAAKTPDLLSPPLSSAMTVAI